VYEIPLLSAPSNSTPQFISTPLHAIHAYRGLATNVTSNTVTFLGSPGFTPGAFAPHNFGGGAGVFPQYLLIVRRDADKATNDPANLTGDWWLITSNSTDSVTLNPAQGDPSALLGAGDQLEIRRLTSLKDLFGGAAEALNHSTNGTASTADEDVIRTLVGISFAKTIFYINDGPGGFSNQWIVAGVGAGDGAQVTFEPDEALLLYRKASSPPTNIAWLGQVQNRRLTHYLAEGASTAASPFPANAPLATSNLKEAGWISSTNYFANPADEDVLRPVIGTSFGSPIFHISNMVYNTWAQGANTNPVLTPAGGYIFYIKSGSGGRIWRQNAPFPVD
jgi:uncharacterized protein (TIGR02597 family)